MRRKRMQAIDLFSGCGGLSLGLMKAGIEVIAAYDNWDPAINVYNNNIGHGASKFDLTDIESFLFEASENNTDIDVVAGGPPCQEFSHAGLRSEGIRAKLTPLFGEIVSELLPKYFILENVDRTYKSIAYRETRTILRKAGYGLTEKVLDASFCGAPQKRKRFFCIGALDESDNFLATIIEKNLRKERMTVKEYFKSIKEPLDIKYYYRHPRNYSRRGIFSVDEPAPTMRGVNRPVPSGYLGHAGDPVPVTPDIRPLTTRERAIIQTFPKNFMWAGTKTNIEQMIGNAVPVDMAYFVAKCLLEYCGRKKSSERRVVATSA